MLYSPTFSNGSGLSIAVVISRLHSFDPVVSERPMSVNRRQGPAKKSGRPHTGRPGLAKSSGEEGKTHTYNDGGFALAVGFWLLGFCAGVVPVPVLVIRRIFTRRFLARPPAVLFVSTGLSLPSPIR